MARELRDTLPTVQLNDRIAIFGGTGTGKSVLAHSLFRTIPRGWWKCIIDVTDSINEPAAVTFYDPSKPPFEEVSQGDDAPWAMRFVPAIDESLDDQISELFLQIYYHGVCWYWLDEANEISDAHKTAFGLRKVLLQGRKAYVGGASCTPRPKDISKSIITQAQFIAIFALVDYDDRSTVAKNIGMSPSEFDDVISTLKDYEYLWYDVRNRTLWKMPPIPPDIVESLEFSQEVVSING